jgi:hypothetical protein
MLGLGWLMAFNASAIYDTQFHAFSQVRRIFPFLPSSVDAGISMAWMLRASVLVGSLFFVADLALRSHWVRRIWVTVGVAGGSIALLGLLQRATGAILPFWEYRPWEASTFFATYYYHANAGAFLNLVLPPAVGLTLRAFSRPNQPIQRALWFTATLLILIAIIVNTSRGAQFLSLLAILALLIGPARWQLYHAIKENRVAAAVTIAAALAVLFAAGQANIAGTPVQRWRQAIEQIPKDNRWAAYQVAARALPEAGWFGFGPGTFRAVFRYYEVREGAIRPGWWQSLHQDYLQTVLEWGWAGAIGWAVIFFGGLVIAVRVLLKLELAARAPPIYRILPFVVIALAAVALHSLVDFPLQIASLQLYVATYLGICWASGRFASLEK